MNQKVSGQTTAHHNAGNAATCCLSASKIKQDYFLH